MDGEQTTVEYWDPALSSLRKAVAIQCSSVTNVDTKTASQLLSECPSITTDANGNYVGGNYFEIVSDTYVGQPQTTQFQTEIGYIWGSAYKGDGSGGSSTSKTPNTDGTDVTIDGITYNVASNANSEIPREFIGDNDAYGSYYNWYASTAESGHYYMGYAHVSDSICPKGWQLPAGDGTHSENSTWGNLIMNAYGLRVDGYSNARETDMEVSKLPIAKVRAGFYRTSQGDIAFTDIERGSDGARTYLWTKTSASLSNAYSVYTSISPNAIGDYNHMNLQTNGNSLRCILK